MKKIKNTVSLIRDIIMILGLPAVLMYAYTIHQEQIKTKDASIEFLKVQLDFAKELQIDRAVTRLNSQQIFYETELSEHESSIKKITLTRDSLENVIKTGILNDSSIVISKEKLVATIKLLLKGRMNILLMNNDSIIMNNYENQIRLKDKRIRIQEIMINNLNMQIDILEKSDTDSH